MKAYIISLNGTVKEIELTDEQVQRLKRLRRHNKKEESK